MISCNIRILRILYAVFLSADPKCDGSPVQFYGTPSFVVGAMSRVPSLTDFMIPDALCMVLGILFTYSISQYIIVS